MIRAVVFDIGGVLERMTGPERWFGKWQQILGLAKPDPRIYELTCDRLGIEPAEAVLVDDWDVAIAGAADTGMQTALHVDTADTIRAVDALLEG